MKFSFIVKLNEKKGKSFVLIHLFNYYKIIDIKTLKLK
jgi:hypothetical protein